MYSEGGVYTNIHSELVKKPSITEVIPVKGNSMIDEHIADGDMVVVEKRSFANIGDIVVAIINDEQTIKFLGIENNQFVLIPANKNFKTIRPKQDFQIFGVVKGLYRTY